MNDDERMHRWCGAGILIGFLAPACPVLIVPAAICFWRAWRYAR